MTSPSQNSVRRTSGSERTGLHPKYLGYFDCFNRHLFYEAHSELEELWLPERRGANGGFYKGLIQLAGAFVHLQKNRLKPAASLLKLAEGYLAQYPEVHEGLDVPAVRRFIREALNRIESSDYSSNPLPEFSCRKLSLIMD